MDNKNSSKKAPPYLQNAKSSQGNQNISWGQNLKKYDLAKVEQKKAELNPNVQKEVSKKIPIQPTPSGVVNEQKKDCPFCHAEDDSFYLFPVRYAIAKKNDSKFPLLPTQLNGYVSDKSIHYSKYTLKYLNVGYLYALVEYENGMHRWLAYRVNEEGFLAKIKNPLDPDCAPTPYGCANEKHFANSSMICLAPYQKSKAKIAYLLFSKGFLTQARLQLYRKNKALYATEKKWQKIDINQWRSAQKSNHCFNQQVFDKHVPTPSFVKYSVKVNLTRKQKISEKFAVFPKAVCGVAIYDALGITIELNERRNDQFIELSAYMNSYKDGISNHQRFNSIPLIESIEQGLKTKAIQEAKDWAKRIGDQQKKFATAMGDQKSQQQMMENLKKTNKKNSTFPQNNTAQRLKIDPAMYPINKSSSDWVKGRYDTTTVFNTDPKVLEKQRIEENTTKAADEWENKYVPLLHLDKLDDVKRNVALHTQNGMKNAAALAKDHLTWLQSKQLVDELHAFDPNRKENGFVFYEYTMQAMEGTGVTEQGQKFIDQWIQSKTITPANIFMRSVLFNHHTAIQHYNQGTQDFFSTVTNYTDWNTSQSTYKQFIVTIAALDAAWDEWVSNNANKHYMLPNFDKTFVGRIGRWSAEFIRVATQKARAGGTDRLVATQVCTFLYARTGVLDKGINLKSLMFFAVPSLDPNYKPPTDVSKQVTSILNDAKNKGATRTASLVMALEAVNLIFQLDRPIDAQQKLQIFGGACGLITASLELVGVFTAANKNAAHNVIKLTAHSFAVIGSAFFAIYDFRGLFENLSKDAFLALIYASRGAVYFGLSLGYTKISIDFLQNVAKATKQPSLLRFSTRLVNSNFIRLIGRLGSVIWLARFNIAILGLTAIEISYKAFFAPNELEKWCKKSAFGIDAVKFENEGKELEAFNQAFTEVIGV